MKSGKRMDQKEFLERSKLIHENRYDYSKVLFFKTKKKVIIVCSIHGGFEQRADTHMEGRGCVKCQKANPKPALTQEEFIKKSKEVHGEKYDYSESIYQKSSSPTLIICPKHGLFSQKAGSHLAGHGCSHCGQNNLLENKLFNFLKESFPSEKIIQQAKFSWLGMKSLDIYFPNLNIAIEYQGKQHYKPIEFFGGQERFEYQKDSDKIKISLCEKNNIKLIHFSYDDYGLEAPSFPLITSEKNLIDLINR